MKGLNGWLLMIVLVSSGCAEPPQTRAIAEIERLEGKFQLDETVPGWPLIAVDLSFTQANDASLTRLAGVTTLRELSLCGTQITDAGFAHLRNLSNLQVLDLWRCRNFSGEGLARLEGLSSLRRLSLWNTAVTDDALRHLGGLAGLRELDLSHTQITDAGLEHLEGLTALQELGLLGCDNLTDAGVDRLKNTLPDLVITR